VRGDPGHGRRREQANLDRVIRQPLFQHRQKARVGA
jgi:hypothetical protein